MKVLIFGAGDYGALLKTHLEEMPGIEIVGFLDNSPQKHLLRGAVGNAVPVYAPCELEKLHYDLIIISNRFAAQRAQIQKQLNDLNVPENKVLTLMCNGEMAGKVLVKEAWSTWYAEALNPRINWLRNYASYINEAKLPGSVAECGVFRGDYAYFINKYFPNRTFYLFDTFSGFDKKDLAAERSIGSRPFIDGRFNSEKWFQNTSETIVLDRMLYKEKCIIKKGYFPETVADVDDQFCFVNLDMDLYLPMLAGLRFFYEKMCDSGVILLHDYFTPDLPGVKQAVAAFEVETSIRLRKFPIGDNCSIAIIKI